MPRLDITRVALTVLSVMGSESAKHRLRQDRLRRLEAETFLASLTPEQRKLSKKKLQHKFEHKFPLQ